MTKNDLNYKTKFRNSKKRSYLSLLPLFSNIWLNLYEYCRHFMKMISFLDLLTNCSLEKNLLLEKYYFKKKNISHFDNRNKKFLYTCSQLQLFSLRISKGNLSTTRLGFTNTYLLCSEVSGQVWDFENISTSHLSKSHFQRAFTYHPHFFFREFHFLSIVVFFFCLTKPCLL